MAQRSVASGVTGTVTGLVRELRPHQWYKQGVLFLGLVFSRQLLDPSAWAAVITASLAFTAVAGATYIFNDISDLEADRAHPEKRHRPIASGQVSVAVAAAFGVALMVAGLAVAASVNRLVVVVLLAYLGQNALYSLVLKDVILVDVLVVAIGFVLRAIAGVVAIDVYLSPWLIVCTFLLALVLGLGKRRHELDRVSDPSETRASLGEYSRREIDQLLNVVMATLLMSYALYTFFRASPGMMLTLPFAFYGVFRYHHLIHGSDVAGNPEYLLTDPPMLADLVLWSLVVLGVLYRIPTAIGGAVP